MNKYQQKLLSHRFHGLAELEHAKANFKQIGALQIKYFELDTRASKDGELYVCHNPAFKLSDKSYNIGSRTAEQISALHQHQDADLLRLKDALELFAKHANQKQILCIDIKDFGFEQQHLELVRAYQLERRVIFITWIPQVICRLQDLGSRSTLIFSYWNVSRLDLLGKLISHAVKGIIRPIGPYIAIGETRIADTLEEFSVGYQHAVFSTELPDVLLKTLAASGGGICLHKAMYCQRVGEYCKANAIQLWLYNENNLNKYKKLADNELIHVIFSDVAADISRQVVD